MFDLANPDVDVFNSLHKWIQDKIKDNLEFRGSKLEAILDGKQPEKVEKAAPEKMEKNVAPEDDVQQDDVPW